jgi:hypothetical protein
MSSFQWAQEPLYLKLFIVGLVPMLGLSLALLGRLSVGPSHPADLRMAKRLIIMGFWWTHLTLVWGGAQIARGVFVFNGERIPIDVLKNESIAFLLSHVAAGFAACLLLYMVCSVAEWTLERREKTIAS